MGLQSSDALESWKPMIKFLPPKPFRILFLAAAFTCFLASAYAQPAVQAGPEVAAFNTNAVDLLNLPPANGPVVVLAAFHLLNISAIDDAAETVEFSAVTTLTWQDPRQAFDPLQEGVEEKVLSGAFQFNELAPAWYPQVLLSNAAGQNDSRAVLLRVKPDGTNILVETIDALAKVSLGMRRYPFDRHRMELVFEIFGFTADEVVLETNPHWVSAQAQMLQVPQWSLEGVGFRQSYDRRRKGSWQWRIFLFGGDHGHETHALLHGPAGGCTPVPDRHAFLVGFLDGALFAGRSHERVLRRHTYGRGLPDDGEQHAATNCLHDAAECVPEFQHDADVRHSLDQPGRGGCRQTWRSPIGRPD